MIGEALYVLRVQGDTRADPTFIGSAYVTYVKNSMSLHAPSEINHMIMKYIKTGQGQL